MSKVLTVPLAVGTGVVVIVVAIAVVIVVLTLALSMRGRQKRYGEGRRDLAEAHQQAGRAERDRELAQEDAPPPIDPER